MIRFGILGPIEVRLDGVQVRLPSARQRALLGRLLVDAGRPVTGDALAEAIWPGRLPGDPAAALRNQVTRLRRALGKGGARLQTDVRGYRLIVEAGEIDAAAFESLVEQATAPAAGPDVALTLFDQALELCRGAALEEFADLPWAQAPAVRLDERVVRAREQRAECLVAIGVPEEAVAELRLLIAENPYREQSQAGLMRALAAAGRHAEALASLREWRSVLWEEQGLEPSELVRSLEAGILRGSVPERPATRSEAGAVREARTSFIGRDKDVSAVRQLLGASSLVTLIGPGGVGKTRLAVEVLATNPAPTQPQVVCDLAAVRRPTSVARVLATALGMQERGGAPLEQQLVDHVAARTVLLLVDNCEHVLAAVCRVLGMMLDGAPDLVILATSRERLELAGERVFRVEPLTTTDEASPAIRLFCDRAKAADPSITEEDLRSDAVRALCARLDGLPLAIELAAARMPGRTAGELLTDLEDGRLLAHRRTRTGRHGGLDAVVEWSYELLSDVERTVFVRASVFAGSFDLGAAETVLADATAPRMQVRSAVVQLVDRSLLMATRTGSTTRYRLLETLRDFGLSRLGEQERASLARTHAAWVLDESRRIAAGLGSAEEAACVARTEGILDEIRAAHGWLVGADVTGDLELVANLHWYALWRLHQEVFRWAEVAAATAAGSTAADRRGMVLATAAFGASHRGDLPAAREYADTALQLARVAGDTLSVHRGLESVGEVALLAGDLDKAAGHYAEAAATARKAGWAAALAWDAGTVALIRAWEGRRDESSAAIAEAERAAAVSKAPSAKAFAAYIRGELAADDAPDEALAHLRAALELAESVDARLVLGIAQVALATLHSRHHDRPDEAYRYYRDVIDHWHEAGQWTSQWVTLRTLVELLERTGRYADAAVLYGAAVEPPTGAPAYGADLRRLREIAERLRASLGAEQFDAAASRGRALEPEEVVAFARRTVQEALATPAQPPTTTIPLA